MGDGVPGDHPPPRTHHTSACVWGEKMVVFSGGDSGTHSQDNSVYIFDMGERGSVGGALSNSVGGDPCVRICIFVLGNNGFFTLVTFL